MKKTFLTILTISCFFLVRGQNSLSFHHLGNTTFQNTLINASYIPDGKVFFGLPAMSGVHASYNNKLSYNNIFSRADNALIIDTHGILDALQNRNMTSVETDINLLHLGYTAASGATIYVFANERINADFLYPKELIEFIVEGNAGLTDETLKIGKTQLNLTHFREMGVGYRYYIDDANLGLGFRLKYYQGFFNMSTPGNFTADIVTEGENYQLNLEMKNAALRFSGRDIYAGNTGDLASHLISNGNTGFGLDFGFEFDMGQYLTIAGSVNDIGFISWKEDIRNYTLNDTTMRYTGVSLRAIDDIAQVVKDSLVGKFKNELENNDPYNTLMAPRAYLSGKYHLTTSNDVTATVATRYVQGQFKMLYGVGISHQVGNFLTASINATKYPQQIPNLGAALAIKGGPAQLYLAVDQVAYWSVPDFKSLDFRIGINFILGSSEGAGDKSPAKSIFLGKEVEVKGQEGIYTIIDRQKKREVETSNPER